MSEQSILGHDRGLIALMTVQGLERFCYYGLRCMLVLFLVTASHQGGLGWSVSDAILFYGSFVFLLYVLPIFGQHIAEHHLGYRKAIIYGSMLSTLGYFLLGGAFYLSAQITVLDPTWLSLTGLCILLVGNTLFKPNLSHICNEYYSQNDPRYTVSHSVTYLAINIAAFTSPLLIGTIGEGVSWQLGFMAAAVVMGLNTIYQLTVCNNKLQQLGDLPVAKLVKKPNLNVAEPVPLTDKQKKQVKGLVTLTTFAVVFWIAFEQLGGLFSIYILNAVDRNILGFELPVTWFQALNPIFIVFCAPYLAGFLKNSVDSRLRLTTRVFGAMLTLLIAFVVIWLTSPSEVVDGYLAPSVKTNMIWLVFAILLMTIGELLLAPLNNNLMAKLAPKRLGAFFLTFWIVAIALAHGVAGLVGSYASTTGSLIDNFSTVIISLIVLLSVSATLMALFNNRITDWLCEKADNVCVSEEDYLNEELSVVATHEATTEEHV